MRLVAEHEGILAEFPEEFRVAPEASKDTWFSLLNDLFQSERFCEKIDEDFQDYRETMSVQLQAVSGSPTAVWQYTPQRLRGEQGSFTFAEFVDVLRGRPETSATLFVVHATAGHGKTAFAYAATAELARTHRNNPSEPFPVFIPFARYRRFGGVRDILRAELEELSLHRPNSRALLRLIQEGHAVVVLDGFDELIAEVGYHSARANMQALREFLGGSARVVLTTSRLLKNPGTDRRQGEKIAGVQYRKQPGRWRWCADDMNHR